MSSCFLCPRKCGLTGSINGTNYCGKGDILRVARAALHFWEEPCISGTEGSGAVFFTGCNLKCVFCQNFHIANNDIGAEISVDRLTDIFFELKEKGALNINLVTPTHFVVYIAEAIKKARLRGFDLPFVYNSSGYESVESLKILEGLIDVYLPDFKYMDGEKALRYSNAPDYPEVAARAIDEMFRQTGPVELDDRGIVKKGVIVRHLLLPGSVKNACRVIEYLHKTYGEDIYLSLMSQYTPLSTLPEEYTEINRKVTAREYNKMIDFALECGVTNAYIQEGDAVGESFIPAFDLEGVLPTKN